VHGVDGRIVLTVGSTYDEIDRAGLRSDWQGIPERLANQAAACAIAIYDQELPTEATRRLIPFFGYPRSCTSSEDRLLIGGFMVEVPFYAQRLFAAGQGISEAIRDRCERALRLPTAAAPARPFALVPGGDDWKDFTESILADRGLSSERSCR